MLLTEEQRLLLKTNTAESRVYLSVYQPTTLLACRVNMASPFVGAVGITFDGVTSGAYTNVFKWATVLVGTTPGNDDVGIIWARECSSDTLIVGLNNINWQNDLYLTVLNFVDIWNRPFSFYFINDQIIYEIDGDTAFSDEDVELGTFLTMGGNYAGFVGDQVYWDASDSENVAGNSVSYVWEFEGGDISIHSGSTVGYVTYDTPGHYKTKLTGTSSNGHVNVGYRYVSIYDRVGENAPIESAEFTNFSGSREEGGWEATCTILQEDVSGIRRGYPTVVFARHNFGGTESDLFKILFSGYVVEKTGNYDHIAKRAEFVFGSGHEILSLRPMTQVSVDDSTTASGWHEVSGMTVKKFLYYYLNYFTTVLSCFDIKIRNGLDTPVKYFETEAQSIYENIHNILNKTREASAVFDKYGIMWVEQNPSALDSYCSNVSGTFGLEDDDYLEKVYVEEILSQEVGVLQLGGFVYNGAGSTQPVLSQSPDTSYIYYFGDYQDRQGFAIESQEELNTIAGNVYAHSNARYPFVEINLFPLYLNFDIAPLQCIPISISSNKNNLGISWDNKSFYCVETSLEIISEYLSILYKIGLHEVTQGFAAETLIIPQPVEENIDPGVDPGDFPVFPFPHIEWPEIIPVVPPVIPGTPECPTDAPANGPYGLGIYSWGILSSAGDASKSGYIDVVIRTDAHDNKTTYVIKGTFQKLTKGEDPELDSSYTNTLEDEWYDVYAYNAAGTLIATGVHDPVVNSGVRTGKLNAISATQIHRIEITVGGGELFRPETVTQTLGNYNWQATLVSEGTKSSGNWGSGVWARTENAIWTCSFGGGAGEGRSGGGVLDVDFSDVSVGDVFRVKEQALFRLKLLSGDGQSKEISYSTAQHWLEELSHENIWGETYDPPYVAPTSLIRTQLHDYLLTATQSIPGFLLRFDYGGWVFGTPGGTYETELVEHTVWVKKAGDYRIIIDQINIWNVCPRVE